MRDASTSAVLRGAAAESVSAARFEVNLRAGFGVPESVLTEARAAGHAAGFASGWSQGQREAELETERLRQHLVQEAEADSAARVHATTRAVTALAAAAARLDERTFIISAELETTILETAFGIAEAILGRELSSSPETGPDALRRALALAPTDRAVTVRLNPADHAVLVADQGAQPTLDGRTVTLVADHSLTPGDALAVAGATSIDARIATALERVREALA